MTTGTKGLCVDCGVPTKTKGATRCMLCNAAYGRYVQTLVDEVAVDRAVRGHEPLPHLNYRERRAAVAALYRRGYSIKETADILGCSTKTVIRHRRLLRDE